MLSTQSNTNSQQNDKQIVKYQTNKSLVEAIDFLEIGKVRFQALDYSKGTKENAVFALANMDKTMALLVSTRIINGVDFGVKQEDGSITLISENKILAHKTDEKTGLAPVTILSIVQNAPSMRLKYKITIENGVAKPEKTQTNGIKAAKGSYKREKNVQIFLSEQDMSKYMMQLKHYIDISDIALKLSQK